MPSASQDIVGIMGAVDDHERIQKENLCRSGRISPVPKSDVGLEGWLRSRHQGQKVISSLSG